MITFACCKSNLNFGECAVVFDKLGEVAAGAALCDEVELDAARGDVPDRVKYAGHVGVRRELSKVHQPNCMLHSVRFIMDIVILQL